MTDDTRYTIHGIRIFETPVRICTRFKLQPSGWLPRLPKPKGVYRKMIAYGSEGKREEIFDDHWWSGYDFLFHLVDEETHPRLYAVVGQLYEIAAGVYDYIDWSKMMTREEAEASGHPFPNFKTLVFPAKLSSESEDKDD